MDFGTEISKVMLYYLLETYKTWDQYLIAAVNEAAKESTCKYKEGCIIVDKEYNIVSSKCNDNIKGAIESAIESANNANISLEDCILYTPIIPSIDVIDKIIMAGITGVVIDHYDIEKFESFPGEAKKSKNKLENAGIVLRKSL